jgi:hypothetical protein
VQIFFHRNVGKIEEGEQYREKFGEALQIHQSSLKFLECVKLRLP